MTFSVRDSDSARIIAGCVYRMEQEVGAHCPAPPTPYLVSPGEFDLLRGALGELGLQRLGQCGQKVYVLEGLTACDFICAVASASIHHYCKAHCLHRCACQSVSGPALATVIAARVLEAVGASSEARALEVEAAAAQGDPFRRLWLVRGRFGPHMSPCDVIATIEEDGETTDDEPLPWVA